MIVAENIGVTVAPGRSIVISVVVDHQWINGQRHPVFGQKIIGPGETADVPADEVELLIERGFIVDPTEPAPAPSMHAPDQSPSSQPPGAAA